MLNNQDRAPNTADNTQSIRGKVVFDAENAKVGTVSAVDAQGGYFVMQKGLFSHDLYIPLSAVVRSNSTAIALNLTKENLKDSLYSVAPTTSRAVQGNENVTDTRAGATDTRAAASEPGPTATDTRAAAVRSAGLTTTPLNTIRTEIEDITVPIREETLLASKVSEKIGDVRVHRYVVEEEQTIVAPITHEEISIEHIVVTNQAAGADAFTEKDIDVPVMGERLIVGKETHVVEEVHIYKHQVTEQQQASGVLRKEHLTFDGDVRLEDDARDARRSDVSQQDRTLPNQGN